MSSTITCDDLDPLLPLIADGQVDPDSEPQAFAHIAQCPDCQQILCRLDLISIAISRSAPTRRQRRWLPWAAAAVAASLTLGALGIVVLAPTPRAPAAPVVPTVVERIERGGGQPPAYRITNGTDIYFFAIEQLDGGATDLSPRNDSAAVRYQR